MQLISAMADNAAPFYQRLSAYLTEHLGTDVAFLNHIPWQERMDLLYRGEVEIGFICGLPFIQQMMQPDAAIELLAAPVMAAPRYQNRPIYFSDVVVHRDSEVREFTHLRGRSWAYNEPNSQSGYNLTRYHLATLGETNGFFGRVLQSGAHQKSLRMVIDGEADAASIDSIVLEAELAAEPHLARQVRTVATLGPSPIPPALIARRLEPAIKARVRQALLEMHMTSAGRAVLDANRTHRFASVTNEDYHALLRMAELASTITLQPQTL